MTVFSRQHLMGETYRLVRWLNRCKRNISPQNKVQLIPYRGFGTVTQWNILGRLQQDLGIKASNISDSSWKNLKAMYKRYASAEIPQATVQTCYSNQTFDTQTNEAGLYQFSLTLPSSSQQKDSLLSSFSEWKTLPLQAYHNETKIHSTAEVLVVGQKCDYGIISDIDDTIIKTEATSLRQMAKIVLFGNAHTRIAFENVSQLYYALQRGKNSQNSNPIFYVSSSSWNLYDMLVELFEINRLPKGVFLLRELGAQPHVSLSQGHNHKLEKIRHLLNTYPDLPFILLGDSGQHDPEIYHTIVREFPNRILSIYIRKAFRAKRDDAEIHQLAEETEKKGVPMILIKHSDEILQHAQDMGLIPST